MKLKEAMGRIWRSIETCAFAMDYDEKDELRSRIDRLERVVTEIDERKASKS